MIIENAHIPKKVVFRRITTAGIVEQVSVPSEQLKGIYSEEGIGKKRYGIFRSEGRSPLYVTSGYLPEGIDIQQSLQASPSLIRQPEKLFSEGARVRWSGEDPENAPTPAMAEISRSLCSGFKFNQEDRAANVDGLRPPQIGALHAVLGHWSALEEPATVVMPTGTGKTETMLALLAHGNFKRLLVLVPWVPLRDQTVRKFSTLGLLRKLGIIPADAPNPSIGTILHQLNSAQEVDDLFECCNVVIGIMSTIAGSAEPAVRRIAEIVSHVFIDEAHHVAAPTWSTVKGWLRTRPLVQFTATPYRRDGKRVDGKIVYNYPLLKAQAEDYFRPIRYRPVFEFTQDKADAAIAEAALNILKEDRAADLDHLMMVRAETIKRAKDLHALYIARSGEYNPVIIHSHSTQQERKEALAAIHTRRSRIVVCVDMLGEGFDLPQLKIAAIHEVHKSLAITLQFTGRFTRSARDADIGDAAMVVNAGDVTVDNALRDLYAEDADWNRIIQRLGDQAIGRKGRQSAFQESFQHLDGDIPLQNIFPKMSTVIYRTECAGWTPQKIEDFVDVERLYWGPAISDENKVVLFVTREMEDVDWGDIRELRNTIWDLYLLHWDDEAGLLYINSSNKSGLHDDLARIVCGETVSIIEGETVYRALHGIKRLTLMNLGLSHATGRAIRHEMLNGTDVADALRPGHLGTKRKTNLFGRGYNQDGRCSIGCSTKGRVWSHKAADDLSTWIEWCRDIGGKVVNDSITPEDILKGVIKPVPVTNRPKLVPLAVDWNSRTYLRSEDAVCIKIGEITSPFYEIGMTLLKQEKEGSIPFRIHSDEAFVEYEAVFHGDGVSFKPSGEVEAFVVLSRRTFALSQLFKSEPPQILFEADSYIEDNLFFEITREQQPFDREAIDVWDWSGVDLTKESQRKEKRPDSIQRKVIEWLEQDDTWEFIFDDDSSGEAADVVAVKRNGEFIHVRLIHCKFAADGKPAALLKDLYEVCGQSQKCIRWRESWDSFFPHLRRRERNRVRNNVASRIERGDPRMLVELVNQSKLLRPKFEVFIVQPGLSKARASDGQLHLLSATEIYLADTWSIPLRVIGSA